MSQSAELNSRHMMTYCCVIFLIRELLSPRTLNQRPSINYRPDLRFAFVLLDSRSSGVQHNSQRKGLVPPEKPTRILLRSHILSFIPVSPVS